MKKLLKILGWSLVAIAGFAVVGYAVAWSIARSRYEREWVAHEVDFPIPFPLDAAELEAMRAERVADGAAPDHPLEGVDLRAVALDRAVARGERIVTVRAGCNGCHGADFGGRTLIDEWFIGYWAAPNLTSGKGSVASDFDASDWDLTVRHGLRHNRRTSTMPSVDFTNLSDRELSDVVAYIRSKPAVDNDLGPTRFGPVLAWVFATNPDFLATFDIDHAAAHAREPPVAAAPEEFGRHLVQVCRGCHGPGLSGGRIQGDPGMPFVANLTPHETGLKDWSEADFVRAFRQGRRPDGSVISEYMPWKQYGRMSDDELKAMYAYLRTVAAREKGNR